MKSLNIRLTLAAIILCSTIFSSCLKDSCRETYDYKVYKPVYMDADAMRASVQTMPAMPLVNPGKIYYKAPYLFVNEVNKGIHIYDDTNPAAPLNVAFINIPGNLDIAVKGNILYADCAIDLLAFDISDPASVTLASRLENVLPNRINNGGFTADISKGVVIDWTISDTSIERVCTNTSPDWWEGDMLFSSDIASSGSNSTTPGIGVAGSTAQFAITDNYLYCLVQGAMNLYDISNAASPVAGNIVEMGWNIETIFPYGNYLFIGTTTGVMIYDNTNPSAPQYMSAFLHFTSCDPVIVSGNFAYSTLRSAATCGGTLNELDIINISNIENPVLEISYPLNSPYGLGIDENTLFICDGHEGLKMFNASNIYSLELKQTIPIEDPSDVIPLGGLLIVTAKDGIHQFSYDTEETHSLSVIPKTGL